MKTRLEASANRNAAAASAPQTVLAACAVLEQGEAVLQRIRPEQYARPHPLAFDASIGGHYRHCLDHFISLLRALDEGEVDYDRRARDARLEEDPSLALETTRQLRVALGALGPDELEMVVPARCSVSYGEGAAPRFTSTLGRELVYVIAHAIHHYALIALLARLQGLTLPEEFGLAPSTAQHRALQATGA